MGNSILIVEEHNGVRDALRNWLEAMFPACRIRDATSVSDAVLLMRAEGSRVVVIDDSSVQTSVIQALQRIKAMFPRAAIIVLVAREYEKYHRDVELAGASACVPMWEITKSLQSEIDGLLRKEPPQ